MVEGKSISLRSGNEDNSYSSSVISFKDINWVDHKAYIMNMTESSVRVESDRPIDPGFVWFNDRVRGHKGGMLLWCQKFEERYRSVIRLVPLTREEEQSVQEQALRSSSHRPHRAPEEIIATLSQSMKRKSS
jgi:hypothetical protein